MSNIEELKESGFSIQQINQLLKINERGYDISYLSPELLDQNVLRSFLTHINNYTNNQKQLVKYGIEKKYNILYYNNSNLNEKQMEMIIMGIEDGLDVSYYADAKYNLAQMREIHNLLQYNLINGTKIDIKKIAKVRYNYNQMHEITLGLIENIDTSIYENPDYSCEQMQLIRLGLENKLDVKQYANPNNSIEDMNKIMHQLKGKQSLLIKFFKKKRL